MVDIDERVVQMKFDSSDFEQKSKSTLSILDKLHNALSFKDAASDSSLDAIADNVQKVADKAYTIVDRMIDKIKDNIANKLVAFLQQNTIGQLQAGWGKYADMTTAVATLRGQGYEMSRITDQLERLNYFTDETSFEFTKMVGEIGKFTASGQSLEDATTAMMGIANWAALSGKNAQEASRAMYQLSQALGAGQMRLVDYKSIQNLNMDTIEFRRNAIEAAVAVGTLKDNLNGTWTSLTGKGETFTMNQFADKLSKNAWFNTKVMMATYKKYSEAVDEVRDIYEYGKFFSIDSTEPEEFETTAQAIKVIKQNNEKLVEKFKGKAIDNDEVDILLNRWKKVEIVTDETIDNYAEINKVSKQIAKQTLQKNYLNYIKEYSEVFQGTEEDAKKALNDWHTYVSTYGIKAFSAAQEAKTFKEAIESAKDAASTVWTTIYTNVFGNYEEAKELWTDLANSLYEIFVNRLWDINDVFEYWKTGGRSVLDKQINDYEAELKALKKKVIFTDEEKERMEFLHQEIERLNEEIKNTVFINGRTRMFQGIYAFGAGAKSMLFNIRDAWDDITEDNQGGKRLLSFSEKLRTDGLRFYKLMKDLGDTDFYTNIAQGIKNLLAPINGLISVVASAIGQFLPKGQSVKDTLVMISEKFKDLTERLVPTQETLKKLARILRGVISVFMILVKAAVGLYQKFVGPVLNLIMDALGDVFDLVTEILADLGDVIFEFEEGLGTMESMTYVGGLLKEVFHAIFDIIGGIIKSIISFLAPAINIAIGLVKKLYGQLKKLFTGNGNPLIALADHFKTLGTRMKEAFFSGESLVDIFNQFREGKGISNFLEMLGTMLDNIIRRIGNTIAAILGLDEAVDSSAIGGALDTFKSVIYNAFTIVAWLYMNVIRPVLSTLIVGVANMLRDLGAAVRDGDVKGALALIRDIAKTFTSIGLFKFINTLTKIMGSGGILHVLHNAAKTLKQIWRYFDALALKEFTNALLRLAIVFGIFTGIAVTLTFIPTGNLEKAKMLLLAFGAAVAIILLEMIIMVGVSKEAEWALVGLTGAFSSMTALMITFIVGAALFNFALDKMTGGTKDFGEMMIALAKLIAPVITTLLTLVVVFRLLRVLSGGGINVITFGLGFIGIVSAVGTLINAMRTLIDLLNDPAVGPDRIAQAMLLLTGMFMFISLSARLTGQVMGNNELGVRSGVGQGIAQAILMASLALIIRFVLIPTLESLVEQAPKFPIYAQAMIIIAGAMLSMAGTVALMGTHLKIGSLNMIAAGALFYAMAMIMKNVLVPVILYMKDVGPNALSGTATMVFLMLGLAAAIRIVVTGITYMIAAMATVPWRSWVAMIGSVALLIAGVMAMSYLFEKEGLSFNTSYLFAALGVVVGIVVAFGLFILVVSRNLNIAQWDMLVSIFKWMSIVTLVIIAGITGTAVLIKQFYGDDVASGILVMSKFSEYLLGTLSGIFLLFGAAIWALSTLLKTTSITDVHKLTNVMKLCLHSIEIIIGLFVANSAFAGILNGVNPSSSQAYLDAMSKLMVTAIGTLVTVLLAMGVFVRLVTTGHTNISPNELATISVTMVTLMIILGEISLLLVPALQKLQGIDWKPIAAMFAGLGFVIIAILGMTAVLSKASATMVSVTPILAGITSLVIGLLAISVMLPIILDAFSKFKDINEDTVNNGLKAFLVPFGVMIAMITIVAAGNLGLKFLAASAEIAGGLTLIGIALMGVAVGIAMIKEIFAPGSTWLSNGFNIMSGLAAGIEEGKDKPINAIRGTAEDMNKEFTDIEKEHSPSDLYKKYGKFINRGLAIGLISGRNPVKRAAISLALFTNEAFCDELGIASPSKVFYENGRFVVRGFINGMGDETNKNKKAGADMADGFAEGMDKALENAKSEWAGLWDGLDFDEEAEKAGESGAKGFWESFKDSLLGESESDPVEMFDEGDQRQLDENIRKRKGLFNKALENDKEYQKIKNRIAEIEVDGVKEKERQEYEEQKTALAAREQLIHDEIIGGKNHGLTNAEKSQYKTYTDTIIDLEKKKTGKSKSTIGNWLDGLLGGATGEGSSLWENAQGIGGTLIGGIASVFGVDTSSGGNFFSTMKENLNSTFEELGIDMTGEGGAIDSLGKKITDFFAGDSFLGTAKSTGSTIGENIASGIEEGLWGYGSGSWFDRFMTWVTGDDNQRTNMSNFENWYKENAEKYGLEMNTEKGSNFYYKVLAGIREFGSEGEIDTDYFKEYAEEYNALGEDWKLLDHLLIDEGFWFINEGNGAWKFTNKGNDKRDEYAKTHAGYRSIEEYNKYENEFWKNFVIGSLRLNGPVSDEEVDDIITKYGPTIYEQIMKQHDVLYDENGNIKYTSDQIYDLRDYIANRGYIEDYQNDMLQKQIEALLTKEGYTLTADLTNDQLKAIKDKANEWKIFDGDSGTLVQDIGSQNDMVASLVSYVREICTDGVKITETNAGSTYAQARDIAEKLAEARRTNNTTDIANYTAKMNQMKDAVKTDYNSIKKFMESKEFQLLSADRQQDYKDRLKFYENYFGIGKGDIEEYDAKPNSKMWKDASKDFMSEDNGIDNSDKTFIYDEEWAETEAKAAYDAGNNAAENDILGYEDALKKEKEKLHNLGGKDFQGTIQDGSNKTAGRASPSDWWREAAIFDILGYEEGIREEAPKMLKDVLGYFSIAQDMVEEDTLEPTIGPVLDGSNTNIGAFNKSISGLGDTTRATVQSFRDDTVNYNSRFDTLVNAINGTNTLVNNLMNMLAEGDIVNINVTGEVDTNNLYELVVNTNREKFKQTGKNKLMSY